MTPSPFSGGRPLALAERLLAFWATAARSGRGWVEQTFGWDRVAPRIASVYEQLAGRRRDTGLSRSRC